MGFRSILHDIAFHYSQFYFVTVSTTLTTGVLGLPTTLVESGFLPFLIMIFLSYFIQILTVIFFTETLQKAYHRAVDKSIVTNEESTPVQLQSSEIQTYGSQDDLISKAKPSENLEPIQRYLPNWHSLGELYLPHVLSYLCTLNIIALAVTFGGSYILSGGQSYAILTGSTYYEAAAIFTWVLALASIILDAFISEIITILTLFKGAIFVSMIIITFVASLQHPIPSKSNFSYTQDSFIMSMIALASFSIIMPLMFRRVKQTKTGIIGFNASVILALTTNLILYIMWCWSILAVVPQHSICLPFNNTQVTPLPLNLYDTSQGQCIKSPSLENALENGQIATVPLTQILKYEQNPVSHNFAIVIEVFVAMSVSIAFLITGSVLYHTLIGVIHSYWDSPDGNKPLYGGIFKRITVQMIREWYILLIIFLFIYAIAFCNPTSFNVFVQQAGSLFVSIQFGILLATMIFKATYSSEFRSYVLPLQLPRWLYPTQFLIPLYYLCCIGYNIYTIVK